MHFRYLAALVLLLGLASATSCNKTPPADTTKPPTQTEPPITYDPWFDADTAADIAEDLGADTKTGVWVQKYSKQDGYLTDPAQIVFPNPQSGKIIDEIYSPCAGYFNTNDGGEHWSTSAYYLSADICDRMFVISGRRMIYYAASRVGNILLEFRGADSNYTHTEYYAGSGYTVGVSMPSDSLACLFINAYSANTALLRFHYHTDAVKPYFGMTEQSTGIEDGSAGCFSTESNGVFATSHGQIFTTTDSGAHWSLKVNMGLPVLKVYFSDAQNGFALTTRNVLYRTRDGGESWQAQTIPGTVNKNRNKQIVFTSPAHGFLATGREVYESRDGGDSWVLIYRFGKNKDKARVCDISADHAPYLWMVTYHKASNGDASTAWRYTITP